MEHLGYPAYLLGILGFWMIAAVVALWLPGLDRLREWAYAGIVFQMTGAFVSHLFVGDALGQSIPVLGLLGLAVASYLLRSATGTQSGAVESAQPQAAAV